MQNKLFCPPANNQKSYFKLTCERILIYGSLLVFKVLGLFPWKFNVETILKDENQDNNQKNLLEITKYGYLYNILLIIVSPTFCGTIIKLGLWEENISIEDYYRAALSSTIPLREFAIKDIVCVNHATMQLCDICDQVADLYAIPVLLIIIYFITTTTFNVYYGIVSLLFQKEPGLAMTYWAIGAWFSLVAFDLVVFTLHIIKITRENNNKESLAEVSKYGSLYNILLMIISPAYCATIIIMGLWKEEYIDSDLIDKIDESDFMILSTVIGIWTFITVVDMVIVTLNVTRITRGFSKTPHHICSLLHRYSMNFSIREALLDLLRDISHRDVKFTTYGVITLDGSLLQTIFGTMVTYLIILVQFHD
ncbi:hypothetical protein KQX54_019668 [Cotesia glomerata]|uniref:Gustatory receptor n=1 Tax=Cotesia glomerata TaxID=32391 RepID=A0AAV7HUJ4_COTGL|nr:hypothetical protein KQX54_019668 [Cotesia glomerata]